MENTNLVESIKESAEKLKGMDNFIPPKEELPPLPNNVTTNNYYSTTNFPPPEEKDIWITLAAIGLAVGFILAGVALTGLKL